MTFAILFVGLCTIIVMAVCIAFVVIKEYSIGFVGGLGLMMLCAGAFTRFILIIEHMESSYISPVSVLVWGGIALYLGDRFRRFLKRYKNKGCNQWYSENEPRRQHESQVN